MTKLNTPRDGRESYNQSLGIQHVLKIVVKLNIEDRITRFTLDSIIEKPYTYAGRHKYRETLASAQMRSGEDGQYADRWFRCQAGEEVRAGDFDTSFSDIKDADLFKTVVAGDVGSTLSAGTLLDKIKAKISSVILLEELKFFFLL